MSPEAQKSSQTVNDGRMLKYTAFRAGSQNQIAEQKAINDIWELLLEAKSRSSVDSPVWKNCQSKNGSGKNQVFVEDLKTVLMTIFGLTCKNTSQE